MNDALRELLELVKANDGINDKARLARIVTDTFRLTKDRSCVWPGCIPDVVEVHSVAANLDAVGKKPGSNSVHEVLRGVGDRHWSEFVPAINGDGALHDHAGASREWLDGNH